MKRTFIALAWGVLLFAACISRSTPPSGPIVSFGGPTPTPNLGQPDGVEQVFLQAWMEGNYEGMYSHLSPNSQTEYSLEEFTDTYTSTAATITQTSVDAALLSALQDTTGTTAQLAFRVTYITQILGSIEQNLTMNLVLSDNRWGVVWTPALIFPELAGVNTLALDIEIPSRANIYDRNGQWLVSANASAVTITIVPGLVSPEGEAQMLALLSHVLRVPPESIQQQYAGAPADWVIPIGDTDIETVQQYYYELNSYQPALNFQEKTGRRYFNVLAPHVLGYTSLIPEDQLAMYQALGYQGHEIVGLAGLEKWGESYLAGTRGGVLSAYTPSGQYSGQIARREAQPAQSIYTTLDRDLQAIVQDAIEEAYTAGASTWAPRAGGAAVVVMDVNTGAVLAMASYPYYDPNVLNPYNNHPLASTSYITDLLNDPRQPFLNRATQGEYPPGSLFKLVTMAAALGGDLFEADYQYTCTGMWAELGEADIRQDWLEGGHGTINLEQALTGSCNPYFYHVGLITGRQDFNLIPDYAVQFGLGRATGIQIEEETGLIPNPDWMQQTRGEDWTLSDSVNIAIGQGDILVTPLQMAVVVSAIANGGTIYQPTLVDHIGLIGEAPSVVFEPQVAGQLSLSGEDIQSIRSGMRGVTSTPYLGTAQYRLGTMEIAVAGKTGTAQVGNPDLPPIAWFGGYAPYDDPEIAVVVMLENAGQGSGVAAPIFRRIVEKYYGVRVADYPPDWYDPSLFHFVD